MHFLCSSCVANFIWFKDALVLLPYKQLDNRNVEWKRQNRLKLLVDGAKLGSINQNVPKHNAYMKDSRF
jgi:hypothetical protein